MMSAKRVSSIVLALLMTLVMVVTVLPEDVFAASAPAKTSIKTLEAKNYGFKVTWTKKSGVTGYQIKYSTSSSFKNSKTVTVKGQDKSYKTIKQLKKSTKYYVRVRTYKTVNGTKTYSKWSDKKSVTTKKSPIKTYIKGTWKGYKIEVDGEQYTMDEIDMTFKLVIGSSTIKAYTNGEPDGSVSYSVKDSTHIKYNNGGSTYNAKVLSNGRLKFKLNDDMYVYLRKI